MDKNHSYWKYAEKVNGRLAMLGLVAATVNYVLFGEIAPGFFYNEIQFTIHNYSKVQTNDSRSRKI